MEPTLTEKFLRREIAPDRNRSATVRTLYGDEAWVNNLDIVNELNGHSGCINALCWSKSGRLLASGSDDTYVNIHTYLPDSSDSQFAYTTAILTGHEENIFSVKFMPYSGDRVIVTAAGDQEVRIFDVEYNSTSRTSSALPFAAGGTRRRRRQPVFREGVSYLSAGDANGKVFRSHYDRVKRIVTESSPYFFLTCSEDGEVRQWDIRAPESAYPRRNFRDLSDRTIPPPLISYGKYRIDLNTISCAPSQPHYIALGGTHPHCFIHDRRMLGRNKHEERGSPAPSSSSAGDKDDEAMAEATRCVRRLARNGEASVSPQSRDHITACKISDAHPNEVIVSWSNDHVYSFDIVRSPDVLEAKEDSQQGEKVERSQGRVRGSSSRKRKRSGGNRSPRSASERTGSRTQTDEPSGTAGGENGSAAHEYEANGPASASQGTGQTGSEVPSRTTERGSPGDGRVDVSDFLTAMTSTSVAEDSEEEEIERFLEQSVLGIHRRPEAHDAEEGQGNNAGPHGEDDDNDHEGDGDGDGDEEYETENSEDSDDSDESEEDVPPFARLSHFAQLQARKKVHINAPCLPHTRVYTGHRNTKTVKDVNFYGLNDEYVVSGSDDGNLFIWDRKSTHLVNILEGDGEVVNVVQGHPYEPMLAVSGIDNTIKIFSADGRARFAARMAQGVSASDPDEHSSINFGGRARHRASILRRRSGEERTTTADAAAEESNVPVPGSSSDRGPNLEPAILIDDEDEDLHYTRPDGLTSKQRMQDEYQITAANENGSDDDAMFLGRGVVAAILAQHMQGAGDEQCRPM